MRMKSHYLPPMCAKYNIRWGHIMCVYFQVKCEVKTSLPKARTANGNCKKIPIDEKPKAPVEDGCKTEECKADEQAFLVALYKYMKERKTPIERIPYLGFKQSK